MKHERTVVLVKPDGLQRSLVGEILHRFERKGLKIAGLKMMKLGDAIIEDHYSHHKDKPFFPRLKKSMQEAPVVAVVLEGIDAVSVVRVMCGETAGAKAAPGTIRGDFSIVKGANIVHASDSVENAEVEIKRFFTPEELFDYEHGQFRHVYSEEEKG
ncbi:MAG: nucleoside-diphosphate kinase [Candidatus Liptonbacteria bacterium]|nr:nucleoside-diphosphate kinase [Candidatus Liptonbacteria bacterium]